MTNEPFLYIGGDFVKSITVTHRTALKDKPYTLHMGTLASLSLTADDANTLLRDLATVLYDHNAITPQTADTVRYLTLPMETVLPVKCPNCGGNGATGPDYDPDPCNACFGTGWKA